MEATRSLCIIDGYSYIFRAFFAIRQYLSTSKGLPTGAIYGFTNMLLKILRQEKPDHIAVVFDAGGETFRHAHYPQYKASRPEMPEELSRQIPYIFELLKAFKIATVQIEGYEADDVIATLAKKAEREGLEVTIVSGDKDLYQLVGPKIKVLDTLREKLYDEKAVEEKMGVPPEGVADMLGLMGDAIDDIPGVPGVGEKTAATLIKEFGTVDNLLANLDKVVKKKLKESLEKYTEQALLSKKLCTLKTDVPLELELNHFKAAAPDNDVLFDLLKELEFSSLLKEFTPGEEAAERRYLTMLKEAEIKSLLESMRGLGAFALHTETSPAGAPFGEIVGIGFSCSAGQGCYLPLGHEYIGSGDQIDRARALELLRPIFEEPSIKKYGHDLKNEAMALGSLGVKLKGASFDTMIASYLLNPSKRAHELADLALEHLNLKAITRDELTGSGAKAIPFSEVAIDEASNFCCQQADYTLRLKEKLEQALEKDELLGLFHDIEMPLLEVLASMEHAGVKVDIDFFMALSSDLERKLGESAHKIYLLAGEEFNINSSQQLGHILFEKLRLPPVKRTKRGYSTDLEVLELLAAEHELPAEILSYRQLFKLKSTYVDALPKLVNPRTGRIHTSFNQTITATGRLSSSDPNLQNIPARTELGRQIRKGFLPEAGWLFLSADYSQIELRILAHLSADELLVEAYKNGEDIHACTACEVFGVSRAMVTPEMRHRAKAVNFGIIYGISPYGLARNLGLSHAEASDYILRYFAKYPRVKAYLDNCISEARRRGYVTTLFKRRRYLPDINSENRNARLLAERTAVNTPIQGSAADIIKMAMINIHRRVEKDRLKWKMILQVHDELLLEVPAHEIEDAAKIVKDEMEGVVELAVPITVELGSGVDWDAAH